MTTTTTKGYLVRSLQDAPTVECVCSQSTRPLTWLDTPVCNCHVTFIKDSVKHYHKQCTEVYLILEATSQMEFNGDAVEVSPGTVVYIEPHTRHRLWSEKGVRTVVF